MQYLKVNLTISAALYNKIDKDNVTNTHTSKDSSGEGGDDNFSISSSMALVLIVLIFHLLTFRMRGAARFLAASLSSRLLCLDFYQIIILHLLIYYKYILFYRVCF